MEKSVFSLYLLRIMISVIGIVGNGFLIISILVMTRVKTFEVLLFGLALINFMEIMLVDIYDTIIHFKNTLSMWSCMMLKLLNICGENSSIFFTVLISIYRYQKMHKSRIAPIFLDSREAAIGLSVGCVLLAVLLGLPTSFITQNGWQVENSTTENCPPDIFQCSKDHCPTVNNIYRYLFIIICHALPLIIVTCSSALIIRILIVQQNAVDAHESDSAAVAANHHEHRNEVFHRSTISILAAMTLFQLYCILNLILYFALNPDEFPAWSELEFFITTINSGIIPYIYGVGNNFFSIKHFMKA